MSLKGRFVINPLPKSQEKSSGLIAPVLPFHGFACFASLCFAVFPPLSEPNSP